MYSTIISEARNRWIKDSEELQKIVAAWSYVSTYPFLSKGLRLQLTTKANKQNDRQAGIVFTEQRLYRNISRAELSSRNSSKRAVARILRSDPPGLIREDARRNVWRRFRVDTDASGTTANVIGCDNDWKIIEQFRVTWLGRIALSSGEMRRNDEREKEEGRTGEGREETLIESHGAMGTLSLPPSFCSRWSLDTMVMSRRQSDYRLCRSANVIDVLRLVHLEITDAAMGGFTATNYATLADEIAITILMYWCNV